MKKITLLFITFYSVASLVSQNKLWSETNYENLKLQGTQYIFPTKFKTFNLDYNAAKEYLFTAPLHNFNGNIYTSDIEINIPLPDGSFELFKIVESPVYEEDFSSKYPDIKTFLAYAPNHPEWYSRFDITPMGFHAIIIGTEFGSIYIDPITHLGSDLNNYLVYYKKDFRTNKTFECGVEDIGFLEEYKSSEEVASRFGSCELRTYRLALAATAEYTQFHGGTVANALAAQVTTINRVNGIYERDIAIHMNIISNNNLLIYTSNPDPYTNNDGSLMLGENQTNVTNVIGSANYDIGHVFSTGGGGIASVQSPCNNGAKARGVTGSGAPINDPFDVDYVSHEMGHQFGGNHTFNGTSGSCGGGNRNLPTAFEPGSGSTIQGYAGICNPQNIQNNSNDYFHGISLEEIGNFITGGGHNCPVKTNLSNNDPSVTYPSSSISIPINTPFALTALGTDPNNNTLTYCWEQMDNENSTQPPVANATGGPNFRSFPPTTNPTRYFPKLADVIAGNFPTWEVLPSVSRTMHFRVMVRDNAPGGGCNDEADITVNVTNAAGPFLVTYPNNNGVVWSGNTNENVTWDVANTSSAPVNCNNVNILISYDGGLTFPDTLAENTANDGNQIITVPNVATTNAYIMVQCANGTFFDVSNIDFTINAVTNDFTINSNSPSQSICLGQNASYTIDIEEVGTFNDNVNLSVSGTPSGVTSNFSTNNSQADYASTLSLTNTGSLGVGSYSFDVDATSTTGTKTLNLTLNVIENLSGSLNLNTPVDGATAVNLPVDFTWNSIAGANYSIIISSDLNQNNVIENVSNLTTNNYTSNNLQTNTTYYWSVTAYNSCDTISSTIFSFTTENCNTLNSTDIPISISATGTPTINSSLVISGANGTVADINVVNLTGTHTYISDLTFTLNSPNGTNVILISRICNNQSNFNINFDDNAASNNYPCPPIDGSFYIPQGTLSDFSGENANGTWTLTVSDAQNQDGGTLDSWGLNICFNNSTACTNVSSMQNPAPACDSIFTASTWYFNDTTFNDTLIGQAANGCDSIITYNLIVNNSVSGTDAQTACNPYTWIDGNTYNTSTNTPTHTLTAANGCDSVVTLDLTINNSVSGTDAQTACNPYTWIDGNTYNTSTNTPTHTLTAANGCDSVVTLDLTINNSVSSTDAQTACNSYTWIDGNTYNTSTNTPTHTLTAANGCDSVVTLDLTITNSVSGTDAQTACNSYTWIDGNTYNTSTNTPTHTLTAANGCDSVVTLDLTITNSVSGTDAQTACNSYTWIDGNTYNTSTNTPTHTLTAANGCDSVVTLDLTINNSVSGTDAQTACNSYTWIDGNTYNTSTNTPTHTLTAANGCDSVVTLDLTINNSVSGTDAQTACNSYTWIDGNTYNTSTNTPTHTLTAANGCDSVVTLDLTINNSVSGTDAQTACNSYTWIDGNTYNTSTNTPTHTLTAANGCDSVVTLDLTINNSVSGTDAQTACNSYTWIDGNTYNTSTNTPTHTLTAANGCDSVVTLDLTINNSVSGTDAQTACNSYTWIDGNTYNTSTNTPTHTLTAANGCDSVVTLDLTINNSVSGTDAQTACNSYTWIDGNTYNTSTNTPTHTLTAANGCDSVVTLDLTINNISTDITAITAGVQSPCSAATNTYTQELTITYTNAPTGTINVNGEIFNLTTSPQTITLTNLTADGNSVDVSAFFTANANCTATENNLFTAPINCTPIGPGDTLIVMMYPDGAGTLFVENDVITTTPFLGIYPANSLINISATATGTNVFNFWRLNDLSLLDYSPSTSFSFINQDTLFAYFNGTVPISEVSQSFTAFNLYPTVFDNQISVEFKVKEHTHLNIDLFSVDGKLIENLFQQKVSSGIFYRETFNVNVSSGMYFISVSSKNSSFIQKVIK